MSSSKKKIAVIGGGMSGMAAVFGITESPNWQENYEITVYQLGWRLGGKGASGRDAKRQQRIDEHGLHVWGGFYENAFRVMQACYREMGRPPEAPLATFEEAFKPSNLVSWMEDLHPWLAWNHRFPEYSTVPGDGTPMPSVWEGVLRIIRWIFETAVESQAFEETGSAGGTQEASYSESLLSLLTESRQMIENIGEQHTDALALAKTLQQKTNSWKTATDTGTFILHAYLLRNEPEKCQPIQESVVSLLTKMQDEWQAATTSDGMRRAGILIDIALAEVKGMFADGVLWDGFDVINDIDMKAWFAKHGASPASVDSALVRGMYDFIFAYSKGNPDKPWLEAGTGLRMIFRLVMWYKGAIFWKMQAGMGDVVFAPLYEVLRARGVRFQFFQQATKLKLSSDKKKLAAIQMAEQVTLKSGRYHPLVMVKDLPCWPSEPLYDQIVQGEELQEKGIDLESAWADWKPVRQYDLVQGVDFDEVVLATSLAPLETMAEELVEANTAWKNMMENVQTVATQAYQIWMIPTVEELGWQEGPTVLTAYGHPFETWADMTQVIEREEWPAGKGPQSIAYFCGPLPDVEPRPPFDDHTFPAKQKALVKQNAIGWIESYIAGIWPQSQNAQGQFRWELLVDLQNGAGPERFNAQYWRANISPAERYVLSVPNTTKYKLEANGTGFQHLYVAGDWIKNGLNFGCIESATMGGFKASQAISGYPKTIVGDHDQI